MFDVLSADLAVVAVVVNTATEVAFDDGIVVGVVINVDVSTTHPLVTGIFGLVLN